MGEKQYPTTEEIISLIGLGTLVVASILMPGLGPATNAISKYKNSQRFKEQQKLWSKYDTRMLKRNLKRLHMQKTVEIQLKNGEEIIKLTNKGLTRYLKFKIGDLSDQKKKWDGKWRLVLYDIGKIKKNQQQAFRKILKQMNFLLLQKSVYLTPYKCDEQIEYLRQYFDLGKEVLYLVVSKIENESAYKKYFGL